MNKAPPKSVLLVEDDGAIATVIEAALAAEGFDIARVTSVEQRDNALSKTPFDIMLTDVMLEDGDGLSTLASVRREAPIMPIIVLSAENTLDTAVRASASDAFEYFPKPFDLDELVQAVRQATGARAVSEDSPPDAPENGLPLVGRSPAMQNVYRMITRVLRNSLTVLITGESGTGKELVAEAIHQLGDRRTGPLVAVNAAAIPANLIESELFGHEKGAFTGAVSQTIGKFEQANGGTLFLDEIGDMPAEAQTRLLRALQSGRIRRVGGRQEIEVDVRIVAATNRDLQPLIASGAFREDLFYRLNVLPIPLPPLRDRIEDIEVLAHHFLILAADEGLPRRSITPDGIEQLEKHPWRGNIRELRNVMFRLAVLARDDTIDASQVSDVLEADGRQSVPLPTSESERPTFEGAVFEWLQEAEPAPGTLYHGALAAFEKPLIEHALAQTRGNQLRAAKLLGINRNTLRKRVLELGIEPDRIARTG